MITSHCVAALCPNDVDMHTLSTIPPSAVGGCARFVDDAAIMAERLCECELRLQLVVRAYLCSNVDSRLKHAQFYLCINLTMPDFTPPFFLHK